MNACGEVFAREIGDILSRRERTAIEHPSFLRAAVIVPLFKKEGNCHVLFTRRTDRVKYHKGQISFPGGGFDEDDADLKRTALRETFEEIGVCEKDIRVLGILDDVVTISQFVVTPYVAIFPYPYPFHVSPIEIDELVEVPLAALLSPECFGKKEIIDNGLKKIVDSYQYKQYTIWGATARILKQFLDLLPKSLFSEAL